MWGRWPSATPLGWKVVMFDMGGVLLTPLQFGFRKYEWENGLASGMFSELFKEDDSNYSFGKVMKGEITLSQFYQECDKECEKYAEEKKFQLPEGFSVKKLFTSGFSNSSIMENVMKAIDCLHHNGYKVALLTNNWTDDTERRLSIAAIMLKFRRRFDYVFESCHIGMAKPDAKLYEYVCNKMNVQPSEVIFLDDSTKNCVGAEKLGMKTIIVKNSFQGLKDLAELLNIDFNRKVVPYCDISRFAHGYIVSKEGIKTHYVECGHGPPVIFCHGWPECWYSWRYQLAHIAELGYRAIALDQRGFGESSCPRAVEEYTTEKIISDLLHLMDTLGLPNVTLVGHDWGGFIVWICALRYPERIRAVAGVNTPYIPIDVSASPLTKMKKNPHTFDYQLYFQDEGVAEAEFEKDIERTFLCLFRGTSEEVRGFLVGFPEKPRRSVILSEEDLKFYVDQFTRTGFRGGINWYRNLDRNWEWNCRVANRKILQPSLMVTAKYDKVLYPALSKLMTPWVPNLTRKELECGHWTQLECPNELNQVLGDWLQDVHRSATMTPRL
ncbi:Bifunctional epoxide hydrolase 2 [Trichoplax sp. H2]|nr:Bifunctional epoxide hydrolase 2 [Trichoplax sp. H2]|eukprot:RDD36665.1 Bifunctional epoxide hydrolase 2 [Trichoplax sp. H2]